MDKEKSIVFVISSEQHKELTNVVTEINKSGKFNVSKRSFCKTALSETLKNYKKVWGIK